QAFHTTQRLGIAVEVLTLDKDVSQRLSLVEVEDYVPVYHVDIGPSYTGLFINVQTLCAICPVVAQTNGHCGTTKVSCSLVSVESNGGTTKRAGWAVIVASKHALEGLYLT